MGEPTTTPCSRFHVYPYDFAPSFEEYKNNKGIVYMTVERCTACGQLHHIFFAKPPFPGRASGGRP